MSIKDTQSPVKYVRRRILTKILTSFYPLTILAKNYMRDVLQGPKYVSIYVQGHPTRRFMIKMLFWKAREKPQEKHLW